MEKTGFYNDLFLCIVGNWETLQAVRHSSPWERHVQALTNTNNPLKSIADSGDIELLINAEELYILREHDIYSQEDPTVRPSLNAALTDFEVIKSALRIVRVPEHYQCAAATYHAKEKRHDVILDGFHKAIGSHIARLGNRLSAVALPAPEKIILRQRKNNMLVARNLYSALQRDALQPL